MQKITKKSELMIDQQKLDSLKKTVCSNSYYWLMFNQPDNNSYLSQSEYFDVCCAAMECFPNELYRAIPDRLSSKQYMKLCEIMAKHGVIDTFNFRYDKFKHLKNQTIYDVMYKICKTAIIANCDNDRTNCCDVIQNVIYPTNNLRLSDYAKLYVYMSLKFPDNVDMSVLNDFYKRRLINKKMIDEVFKEIISTANPEFLEHFAKEYDLWLFRQGCHESSDIISNRETILSECDTFIRQKLEELFKYCGSNRTLPSYKKTQDMLLRAADARINANHDIAQAQRTITISKCLDNIEKTLDTYINNTKRVVYR